ncbi:zinc-binding dehydrogenase [soil metagenome]
MKALVFERKVVRYAAAAVAGRVAPGRGATFGPLALKDVDEPNLPADGWVRVRPRLAGICGSDLATVDGTSSRYFGPIVSFPFTPGHEVVGELDDGSRVVVVPLLTCAVRGIEPGCSGCRSGRPNLCERVAFGHLEPGLQTGFCSDTGGGWSTTMVAHRSQLRPVPASMSDEQAVMTEPAACAVHAAAGAGRLDGRDGAVVIGTGTLGLLTIAALRRLSNLTGPLIVTAKHPHQNRLAGELGADTVVAPDGLGRAVRTAVGSLVVSGRLTGGIGVVVDCVATEASLEQALSVVAPGGTVLVVGMPARRTLDLTSLGHREVALRGCYAYTPADFDRALDLVVDADLGRLVSASYSLSRYREALEHAANAGSRGAVKIVFDLRQEKHR